MNPTSLDSQSGAADDTHIVRIVRLETQMDNVTSTLASVQRVQEQNHLTMLAQFESMRDRMDRQFYWLIGLFAAHVTAVITIVVRVIGT